MEISLREEFQSWRFKHWRSDAKLETSALKLFMVANLYYQLSW